MRPRTETPAVLAAVAVGVLLWLMLGWGAVAAVLVFMLTAVFVGVHSGRRRY